MRLLLIEDESDAAKLIAKGLQQDSHVVDVAGDGESGLHRALSQPYDLVILDVRLPVKDGFTVCRELRQAGLQIPVLMLTASAAHQSNTPSRRASSERIIIPLKKRQAPGRCARASMTACGASGSTRRGAGKQVDRALGDEVNGCRGRGYQRRPVAKS